MGSGASIELNADQKVTLVNEARNAYESGATATESDYELYQQVAVAYSSKYSELTGQTGDATGFTELATTGEEKAEEAAYTGETLGEPAPVSISRLPSTAEVQDPETDTDEDEGDDLEHNIAKPRKGSQGLLATKTSQAMLADLIDEEADRQNKVADFLAAVKTGNVASSKASTFRDRRLTYSHRGANEVSESPQKPKLTRKRTTIYSSSEIGVRQEKKPPFDSSFLGTYSCHGIEPGEDFDDEEEYDVPPVDKINQDRGCVVYPYGNSNMKVDALKQALFLVLDGHGEQGDLISEFVMRQIVVSLEKHDDLDSDPIEALKDTFTRTNTALMLAPINYMTSGTTVTSVYMRDKTIYCANCGDSRTVVAKRRAGGTLEAVDLSRDHKPDDPEEHARIEEWGGFIRPPADEGLSARVYLDPEFTMIGLAMARSIGDFAVKSVGVIAEPEVKVFTIEDNIDEFLIMASDGVWEFIGSQEAVDIVSEKLAAGEACHSACQELIEQATQRWAEEEGDYRDDITAIVVRLPLPFHNGPTTATAAVTDDAPATCSTGTAAAATTAEAGAA